MNGQLLRGRPVYELSLPMKYIQGPLSGSERKAFIRSFVKEMKVTGDDALLTYTMPLSPEGISEERIGVLSAVQYGGR